MKGPGNGDVGEPAGLIAAETTGKAMAVMEATAETEAKSDPNDVDDGLATTGLL